MNRKFNGIHLCRGQTRDSRPFYAYLRIEPERLEEMACLIQGGHSLDLREFGEVLHAGPGEEPQSEVQMRMREAHGEICDWKELSDQ